ncbi:MAG: hypothetical protein C4527_26875 [Candidatus Omnitrophota bacterium]|jgi:hypothetical protein|nr:MAG: hypothetical protein C4527_26875 [Candidatus Omnitrophota bacterium]
MKRNGLAFFFCLICLFPLCVTAQYHYQLSPAWQTGEGVYVVVDEVEFFGNNMRGNRVLVVANIDGSTNPLHAWINQDFGANYTVKCDVRMESWHDQQDLSRGGIAVRLQPQGNNEGEGQDRAINLLFHENYDTVEYLNDFRAWANTNDNQFMWDKGVMYTFELTVTGNTVNGKVYRTDEGPDGVESIVLNEWTHASFSDRTTGFPGITGSNIQGQVVIFDNFQVLVNGEVVFEDNFEGDLERIPQTVGLSENWVYGEGGYWVVDDGVLYGIATSRLDPKKIWFKEEIIGGASIKADVRMLSWHDGIFIPGANADYSRSGVSLHIQPDGRGGGRAPSDRGPGEARSIVMLLHDNINTVEFLNDFAAWANLDDNTIPWNAGTWYTFEMRSDGFVVEGTFIERDDPGTAVEMTPWEFPGVADRLDGFAGLSTSTVSGEMAAFDNVEIRDENGSILFSDDFETVVDVREWYLF